VAGGRRPRRSVAGWAIPLFIAVVMWAVLLWSCRKAGLIGPEVVLLALRSHRPGVRRAPGRHRPGTVVPVGPFYLLSRYRHSIEATLDALGPTPPGTRAAVWTSWAKQNRTSHSLRVAAA